MTTCITTPRVFSAWECMCVCVRVSVCGEELSAKARATVLYFDFFFSFFLFQVGLYDFMRRGVAALNGSTVERATGWFIFRDIVN